MWSDLDRTVDKEGNGYRPCAWRVNGWVGGRMTEGITYAFGVSGENDSGRRVTD